MKLYDGAVEVVEGGAFDCAKVLLLLCTDDERDQLARLLGARPRRERAAHKRTLDELLAERRRKNLPELKLVG
ncbi:MAG TPA: hypothetical protein VGE74_05795 [Gemmata sp.]